MTGPREASQLAEAVAKQAHGGVQHGDNDPRATLDLELRFGIGGYVDEREPRRARPDGDLRPMCAAWADHHTVEGGEGS